MTSAAISAMFIFFLVGLMLGVVIGIEIKDLTKQIKIRRKRE